MANDKRRRMIAKADALVSDIAYLMFRGRCPKCNRTGTKKDGFHPHHIIRKGTGGSNIKTRFVMSNIVWACDNCHTQDADAFHRMTRAEEMAWLEENLPNHYWYVKERADRTPLTSNLQQFIETSIEDLQTIKEEAEELYERYSNR